MALLGKLPSPRSQSSAKDDANPDIDPIFIESVTHWLVLRQTSEVQDEEYDIAEGGAAALAPAGSEPIHQTPLFHVQGASPDPSHSSQSTLPLRISPEELECAGFNGRCNKVADTCYSFWVGGTLAVCIPVF